LSWRLTWSLALGLFAFLKACALSWGYSTRLHCGFLA